MRRLFFVAVLSLAGADRAAAQTAIELFPQDAAAAGDRHSRSRRSHQARGQVSNRPPKSCDRRFGPSELFDQGTQFLRVARGLNRKAPAAIVLLSPEKDEDFNNFRFLQYLVPVLPFTDADLMHAENFGIAKGKLPLKSVVRTDPATERHADGVRRRTQDAHLSSTTPRGQPAHPEKLKSAAASLTAVRSQQFDDSDILLHFGRYLWKRNEIVGGADAVRHLLPGSDPAKGIRRTVRRQPQGRLTTPTSVSASHEGIDIAFPVDRRQGRPGRQAVQGLKEQTARQHAQGLRPDGNVLLAQASSGDTTQQPLVTKVLFNFMLEELLINQRIVHHVDRLTYLGVFQEVSAPTCKRQSAGGLSKRRRETARPVRAAVATSS